MLTERHNAQLHQVEPLMEAKWIAENAEHLNKDMVDLLCRTFRYAFHAGAAAADITTDAMAKERIADAVSESGRE